MPVLWWGGRRSRTSVGNPMTAEKPARREAMTLTEFLLARIAEDEEVAQSATPGRWEQDSGWSITAPPPEDWCGPNVVVETKQRNDAEFIASHNPARVLAECAAKRKVVANHLRYNPGQSGYGASRYAVACLAMTYDHPDYQAEWMP